MTKSVVDVYIIYQIIRRLSTPFTKTSQFEAGLIDKNGNFTKKRKDMTPEEKRELSLFDVMIINIKRLLSNLPGGDSRLRNFASALYLLKEDIESQEADFEMLHELADSIGIQCGVDLELMIEEMSSPPTMTTANVAGKDMPLKTSTVGKCKVFHVGSSTYKNCMTRAKTKNERYSKFIGEGPECDQIREYAKKNPGMSIMLRDDTTGSHTFLRIGSRSRF
jgi:hypothetical protein